MIRNIIITAFILVAISAQAETLEIDGFVVICPDGCQVMLSLDGEIRRVTMPDGNIRLDTVGRIESVGGAVIKRDEVGRIMSIGSAVIKRDEAGQIISVGGAVIKRDKSGQLSSVGGAVIKRDESGTITGLGDSGESVRATFKILADKI
jgi:hypothetical protein